jgi:hypothetical protein
METELLRDALKPGPDCVPIEQLGRYVDGSLAPGERSTVAAHVGRCANCQAELALLRAFTEATVRIDEHDAVRDAVDRVRQRESEILGEPHRAPSTQAWFPLRSLRQALAMAAVLLALAGGFYFFNSNAPRLPSSVGAGGETMRSLSVGLRTPIGDQVENPERFEWQPVAGAVRYHVSLMEVDRHQLWAIDTSNTAVMLPLAVRGQIVPAKTLLWQVKAFGAGDALVAESGVERFRLAPR